jgi:hypothetical protein
LLTLPEILPAPVARIEGALQVVHILNINTVDLNDHITWADLG